MSEPIYEGVGPSTIKAESDYVGMNMNTEPNYEGVAAELELDPEYEPVTGYKRQDPVPPSPIYANTLTKPSHYANSS